jgi:TRAP-type C4-dicarboxylate transport system substrate-binding protein
MKSSHRLLACLALACSAAHAGTLQLTVSGADGKPAANAVVQVLSAAANTALSDANGQVRIEGVPDGAAELRVWHPEQLTDHVAQRLQVGAQTVAQARLKVRAAPPPAARSSEYSVNPR